MSHHNGFSQPEQFTEMVKPIKEFVVEMAYLSERGMDYPYRNNRGV
jgi:hypothetical protein